MLTIGLTGGIASGKSTVSGMLRDLGASIIDADVIVHQLQSPGSEELAEIFQAFGTGVMLPDGSLDRKALAALVFGDPSRRKVLEAILHPKVRSRIWKQVEVHRQAGTPAVVLDVPLLIEGGLYRQMDHVWVVYVPRAAQIVRLMQRNGLNEAEAEARLAAQMDLEEKRTYADLLIDNSGSLQQTQQQVEEAWRRVLST
jgi:dephospho-CoA kinase